MKTSKKSGRQRRRDNKEQYKARQVAARLLGFYLYKCSHCGEDYKSKVGDLKFPCCDECIPF
jgi:hypothetical protein